MRCLMFSELILYRIKNQLKVNHVKLLWIWGELATIGVPATYSRVVDTNHQLSAKRFLSGKGAPHAMNTFSMKTLTLQKDLFL